MSLNDSQFKRYARHIIIPEVGIAGQEKLLRSKVLIVGTGGLGSPAALYLTAAGIGTLGLVDFDTVEESNLQRQIIHNTNEIGQLKVNSARDQILALNPETKVETYPTRLTEGNVFEIIDQYDIILDGTDNFPSRYLLNDACFINRKPLVYGSIFRFDGQATFFNTPISPCYRCLFPEPPPAGMIPSCAEAGVLGVLPGIIGLIQSTEAIKYLLGQGELLTGRLMLFNALEMRFREVTFEKDPDCPLCGKKPTIKTVVEYKDAVCESPVDVKSEITVQELKQILSQPNHQKITLLDVREPFEYKIAHIQPSILIPLNKLKNQLHELSNSDPIYVLCKSGARSARAVELLKTHGFPNAKNIKGGITAWSKEIDPTVPSY